VVEKATQIVGKVERSGVLKRELPRRGSREVPWFTIAAAVVALIYILSPVSYTYGKLKEAEKPLGSLSIRDIWTHRRFSAWLNISSECFSKTSSVIRRACAE